tara:strand:+ start:319 stop:612 length:294 start_codon:yes stop_codon:yes gene_type:complete
VCACAHLALLDVLLDRVQLVACGDLVEIQGGQGNTVEKNRNRRKREKKGEEGRRRERATGEKLTSILAFDQRGTSQTMLTMPFSSSAQVGISWNGET